MLIETPGECQFSSISISYLAMFCCNLFFILKVRAAKISDVIQIHPMFYNNILHHSTTSFRLLGKRHIDTHQSTLHMQQQGKHIYRNVTLMMQKQPQTKINHIR